MGGEHVDGGARKDRARNSDTPATTLQVGRADDPAERDADRTARSVVAALESSASADSVARFATASTGRVRRRSTATTAAATIGAAGGAVDDDTASRIHSTAGSGRPLDTELQRQMGGAFGADFSNVRVHTGPESRELNDRIQAEAFTVGSDIHFRDGMPDTGSPSGQELLAHELTHTLQQSPGRAQRSIIRRLQKTGHTLTKTPIYKAGNGGQVDTTKPSRSTATAGKTVIVETRRPRQDSSGTQYYKVVQAGSTQFGSRERYIRADALAFDGAVDSGVVKTTGDKVGATASKIGETVGIVPEINDALDGYTAIGGGVSAGMESGMGVAAGAADTITMFTGLAESIVAFRARDADAGDKVGAVLNGLSAVGTGAKGVSGIVDKAGAGSDATSAAQGIAGFADAFVGIKDTFFAIKHIVDLVQEADKLNNKEKFSKSMEIITEAMNAAKSGVSSAKAFMDLWGGGAGAPLVNAVPGMGIALAAVDIIIRTVDLVDGLVTRGRMQTTKRAEKKKFGGKAGASSKEDAEKIIADSEDKMATGTALSDTEQKRYDAARDYLMSKGLQYISTKRANRAILKISVAMGKMAGDVATLGGASAPVGVGIKAGAMAVDVGSSLFRRFKQWGRDKHAARSEAGQDSGFFAMFRKDKSTVAKLAAYNRMVDQIFDMIVKTVGISDVDKRETAETQVKSFVNAMGISVKQMDQKKSEPDKLREMMITAMKKRE